MKDEEDVIPTEPTPPAENEIKVTVAPEEPKTNWFDTKPEEVDLIEPKEPITPTEPVIEPNEPVTSTETDETIEDDLLNDEELDSAISNHIKEKYGIDAKLEDLVKPKEVAKLTTEMEKFIEFTKETNNTNYSDFLATQKDWSQESQEAVLKASMKLEKPYLDDSEIDLLYSEKYGTQELDEFADESEIRANKLKEINAKDDFQKGLKILEENKEKYKVAKGFDESVPQEFKEAKTIVENLQKQQEEDDKLIAENRSDYLAQTERIFSNDFKGFEVKIGEETMFVKPENLEETKKMQSNLDEFNNKYFDKLGRVTDPQGLHKALYFAMNPEKVAEYFFNTGKAKLAESDDKLSKNIQTEKANPAPMGSGNIVVKVV